MVYTLIITLLSSTKNHKGSIKMAKIKSNILRKYGYLVTFIISTVLYFAGYFINNVYLSSIGIYLILIYLLIYSLVYKKTMMLIFCISLSFFVLDRPISSFILGIDLVGTLSEESVYFTLFICGLALLSLKGGDDLYQHFRKEEKTSVNSAHLQNNIKTLRIVLIIIIIASSICLIIAQIDKLNYFSAHSYVSLYTEYSSSIPYLAKVGSRFFPFAIICYLATSPKMLYSYITLALLVVSEIPDVIIGSRKGIVLYFIFAIVYIWLRNKNNQSKVSSKNKKVLIISTLIVAIIGIAVLGKVGYDRSNESYSGDSWKFLPNIAYAQSITFDTIRQIYDHQDELPKSLFRNYSFGNIIEDIEYNKITETIFDIKPITNYNSVSRATNGYSMAHQISFIALGEVYLEGYGIGTSYLGEAYIDAGYLGVIILSLLIGYLMAYISNHVFENWIKTSIIFEILLVMFYLPRESFGEMFEFLFSITFWLTILGSLMASWLIEKFVLERKKHKENA